MVSTRVTPNSDPVVVNLIGSSNFGRYNKISAERTWNLFISTAGEPGSDTFQAWLVNYAGYQRIINLPQGPIPSVAGQPVNRLPAGSGRGAFKSTRGNFLVVVVNNFVYTISAQFVVTQIGSLNTFVGEVFMAENLNSQICIVDGANAWIYSYASFPSFTVQTSGALSTGALLPNYVEYHNTFFLFGNANTTSSGAAWYAYSYSNDTTIVQTTQLALQTKSDFAIAIKKLPGQGNNVIVFGNTVCEIHTQVGGLENYLRNPSRNINYGCLSVTTIGDSGDVVAWLAVNEEEQPVIMVYDGNTASRISTDGIDYLLSSLQYPGKSTAMLYRIDGHLVYQLTFFDPKDNLTLLYDFNTKMFFNLTDQYFNFHPARYVVYFNDKLYFTSLNNSALYQLSSDYTVIDENLPITGDLSVYDPALVFNIPRERITASIRQANSTRFRANSLVLTLEQGTDPGYTQAPTLLDYLITEDIFVADPNGHIINEYGYPILIDGLNSFADMLGGVNVSNILTANSVYTGGIPYAPRIDLAISKDGGNSWSNYDSRDLNYYGFAQNILHWENMGVANDLCFKFRFVGDWRWIVNNALVDVIS